MGEHVMSRASLRVLGLVVVLGGTGPAQVNQRLSLGAQGTQANDGSAWQAISADGRYVAFISWASNLVPGDTNGTNDIFVRDRLLGTTERASVSLSGQQANDYSQEPAISADGRFVAFGSAATNLVSIGVSGYENVYVRDLRNATTELVSVNSSGQPGSSGGGGPSISADGRYVAFISYSDNLVPGDYNGLLDVFVRDRQNGTTECVSNVVGGGPPNYNWLLQVNISADGNFVAFMSTANNLVPGVTNGLAHVFVRDRTTNSIECPCVTLNAVVGGRACWSPSISADGRYVAFASLDDNFVPADTNGTTDIFVAVRDGITFRSERVSVSSAGEQANGVSYNPAISADGRYVTFESESTNLVPGDTNQSPDVFVHDRQTGTTERVNLEPSGAQGHYGGYGLYPCISADGRFVAFDSYANDLVAEDTNHQTDVFVRDRSHGPFASLCDPGISGVVGCPCSNPPSGSERGCDNSYATGGASLWISGGEYLSSDTIVFTAVGEPPDALSIVLQGSNSIPAGDIYGQGVRCIGGSLKRMYVMVATGGGRVSGPIILGGEPTVHSRSAALGDEIQAGSTRWYTMVYRDGNVLGGCPASSTFNTTQAREIPWLP
jgi:Tol biopolymer transport system component